MPPRLKSASPSHAPSHALQGLASLTSTIAPAAGGSIYAYFSSLNRVRLLPPPPACLAFSRARVQGWPLNYSFAFIVMSATLALHLGMVWKVLHRAAAAAAAARMLLPVRCPRVTAGSG